MRLLIDGDVIAYQASSAVQKDIDWGDGLWTCHAYLEDAIDQVYENLGAILEGLLQETTVEYSIDDMEFFFSDPSDNFRKHYYPDYKSGRKASRKPTCYRALVKWMQENLKGAKQHVKYLEADDCIGIEASRKPKDAIIVSIDKDFKTIPNTYFYDFGRGEFRFIDKEEAYYWFYYQCLLGDATDGYKGCPSYGQVKAKRLLDATLPCNRLEAVVKAYESQGLTKDDLQVQATMAHILHYDDLVYFEPDKEIPPLYRL